MELNDLIEDVHALISTHMRQKEIAFEFIPDPDLPNISGLSDQIRQVVLNLFFNAIEVMKPGRPPHSSNPRPASAKGGLLAVKDTGPGIDPEILPKIFDPFITSKHTGTGLGLTITHDIIEQHHGRIAAENDPEGQGGAIFKVWLPIDEKDQNETRRHILIIDDEASLRQTLARILQRAGFEVTTAANGKDGLALVS